MKILTTANLTKALLAAMMTALVACGPEEDNSDKIVQYQPELYEVGPYGEQYGYVNSMNVLMIDVDTKDEVWQGRTDYAVKLCEETQVTSVHIRGRFYATIARAYCGKDSLNGFETDEKDNQTTESVRIDEATGSGTVEEGI